MKVFRLLAVSSAALALCACVTSIPTGPEPAYAYSDYEPPASLNTGSQAEG